jgi:hypothetical protein
MNQNSVLEKKIQSLKLSNILHSGIYFISIVIHLIVYFEIYWISKREKEFFFIEIITLSFFSIIPNILSLFLVCVKLTKKLFGILQTLSKVFFYINFFNGLVISIDAWNNANALSSFFKNCPFYYKVDDIRFIFHNFQMEDELIKKECNYRRCFQNNTLIKDQKQVINYICNLEEKEKTIECLELGENENTYLEISQYVKYCKNYKKMYKCEKSDDFFQNYQIKYYDKCPGKSDVIFNYTFGFLFIFIDSFICSLPWLYEYYSYKDLIILLCLDFMDNRDRNNQSLRDTNNTSKINDNENNSNNGNNNNNSQSFERQPTETIIVENNYNNNINETRYVNKIEINEILSIKNNRVNFINKSNILSNKEIKNTLHLSDEKNMNYSQNNISKSDNKLNINENKNIFKSMNENIHIEIKKK